MTDYSVFLFIKIFQYLQGAKIIKASHFDYEFLLGHKIVFICAAKGDPRPRITWFKDGIEIHAHPFLQVKQSFFCVHVCITNFFPTQWDTKWFFPNSSFKWAFIIWSMSGREKSSVLYALQKLNVKVLRNVMYINL